MKKINFGIRHDLQAAIRHEPNACDGFVMDLSLGCPHRCIYCLFSPLELKTYRLFNPGYKGGILPLKLDNFLATKKFPPAVYLCYSSDPLANREITGLAIQVLKKLFQHNVSILFITKGIFTDDILAVIAERPDLMEIQVGITSCNPERNRIVEPGVAPYQRRMENIQKLQKINGLASLTVRIDPIFPGIDDATDNIETIISDSAALGIREAVAGYIILTEALREKLQNNIFLKNSIKTLTEKTPTISEKSLFSLPFNEKLKRLERINRICQTQGIRMAVCGCKEQRLKKEKFPWICHPYYSKKTGHRKTRAELFLSGS